MREPSVFDKCLYRQGGNHRAYLWQEGDTAGAFLVRHSKIICPFKHDGAGSDF